MEPSSSALRIPDSYLACMICVTDATSNYEVDFETAEPKNFPAGPNLDANTYPLYTNGDLFKSVRQAAPVANGQDPPGHPGEAQVPYEFAFWGLQVGNSSYIGAKSIIVGTPVWACCLQKEFLLFALSWTPATCWTLLKRSTLGNWIPSVDPESGCWVCILCFGFSSGPNIFKDLGCNSDVL